MSKPAMTIEFDYSRQETRTLNWFQMWKGMLDKSLTSFKIIASQQQRIRQLENHVAAADAVVHELEHVIMDFGESQDAPRTLRHKLLKVVDEKYHQKTDIST
jgi:hypothetical protein